MHSVCIAELKLTLFLIFFIRFKSSLSKPITSYQPVEAYRLLAFWIWEALGSPSPSRLQDGFNCEHDQNNYTQHAYIISHQQIIHTS